MVTLHTHKEPQQQDRINCIIQGCLFLTMCKSNPAVAATLHPRIQCRLIAMIKQVSVVNQTCQLAATISADEAA